MKRIKRRKPQIRVKRRRVQRLSPMLRAYQFIAPERRPIEIEVDLLKRENVALWAEIGNIKSRLIQNEIARRIMRHRAARKRRI